MEAAVLFTIGGIRGIQTACVLTISDLVGGEQFVRIGDDQLAQAVERMTRLALTAAVDEKD
jgi:uridine phosphorylase